MKKLWLDRQVWSINMTDSSKNKSVQSSIESDLSNRYGTQIPFSIQIIDEHTVKLLYFVHLNEYSDLDPINNPDSVPEEYLTLYSGAAHDWRPEFCFPAVPYASSMHWRVNIAKDNFEENVKRNNKFYKGNRILRVKPELSRQGFSVEIVFG